MPKPSKFTYVKRSPFRDASYFIIICEGQNREPDYFRFFVGLSQRVKIVPVESLSGSEPNKLVDNAITIEKELGADSKIDKVWFVIDTDRWREQLLEIREECNRHLNWHVAQSNPCFEVWLYFHDKAQLPVLENIAKCSNWKPHLPKVIQGGFNPDFHPAAIETAISNAKDCYTENGYFPEPGSTQVWMLAVELMPLIKRDLDVEKHKFPLPVVTG